MPVEAVDWPFRPTPVRKKRKALAMAPSLMAAD
jgi:hypothetical protein